MFANRSLDSTRSESPPGVSTSDLRGRLSFSSARSPLLVSARSPHPSLVSPSLIVKRRQLADYHMSQQNPSVLDEMYDSSSSQLHHLYNTPSPYQFSNVPTSGTVPLIRIGKSQSAVMASLMKQSLNNNWRHSVSSTRGGTSLVELATAKAERPRNGFPSVSPVMIKLSSPERRKGDSWKERKFDDKEDLSNKARVDPCDKNVVVSALKLKSRKRWNNSFLDDEDNPLFCANLPTAKRSRPGVAGLVRKTSPVISSTPISPPALPLPSAPAQVTSTTYFKPTAIPTRRKVPHEPNNNRPPTPNEHEAKKLKLSRSGGRIYLSDDMEEDDAESVSSAVSSTTVAMDSQKEQQQTDKKRERERSSTPIIDNNGNESESVGESQNKRIKHESTIKLQRNLSKIFTHRATPGGIPRKKIPVLCASGTPPELPKDFSHKSVTITNKELRRDRRVQLERIRRYLMQDDDTDGKHALRSSSVPTTPTGQPVALMQKSASDPTPTSLGSSGLQSELTTGTSSSLLLSSSSISCVSSEPKLPALLTTEAPTSSSLGQTARLGAGFRLGSIASTHPGPLLLPSVSVPASASSSMELMSVSSSSSVVMEDVSSSNQMATLNTAPSLSTGGMPFSFGGGVSSNGALSSIQPTANPTAPQNSAFSVSFGVPQPGLGVNAGSLAVPTPTSLSLAGQPNTGTGPVAPAAPSIGTGLRLNTGTGPAAPVPPLQPNTGTGLLPPMPSLPSNVGTGLQLSTGTGLAIPGNQSTSRQDKLPHNQGISTTEATRSFSFPGGKEMVQTSSFSGQLPSAPSLNLFAGANKQQASTANSLPQGKLPSCTPNQPGFSFSLSNLTTQPSVSNALFGQQQVQPSTSAQPRLFGGQLSGAPANGAPVFKPPPANPFLTAVGDGHGATTQNSGGHGGLLSSLKQQPPAGKTSSLFSGTGTVSAASAGSGNAPLFNSGANSAAPSFSFGANNSQQGVVGVSTLGPFGQQANANQSQTGGIFGAQSQSGSSVPTFQFGAGRQAQQQPAGLGTNLFQFSGNSGQQKQLPPSAPGLQIGQGAFNQQQQQSSGPMPMNGSSSVFGDQSVPSTFNFSAGSAAIGGMGPGQNTGMTGFNFSAVGGGTQPPNQAAPSFNFSAVPGAQPPIPGTQPPKQVAPTFNFSAMSGAQRPIQAPSSFKFTGAGVQQQSTAPSTFNFAMTGAQHQAGSNAGFTFTAGSQQLANTRTGFNFAGNMQNSSSDMMQGSAGMVNFSLGKSHTTTNSTRPRARRRK